MKKLLILFVLSIMSLSCNNDDNATQSPLSGQWKMTHIAAIMPAIPELNTENVNWNFIGNGHTLIIDNVMPELDNYLISSGTYDVTVNANIIIIHTEESDVELKYYFEEDQLHFNNEENTFEEPYMSFAKI